MPWLTTLPGVGQFTALVILAEIGDITRFGSARKLASWAGLTPTVRGSDLAAANMAAQPMRATPRSPDSAVPHHVRFRPPAGPPGPGQSRPDREQADIACRAAPGQ